MKTEKIEIRTEPWVKHFLKVRAKQNNKTLSGYLKMLFEGDAAFKIWSIISNFYPDIENLETIDSLTCKFSTTDKTEYTFHTVDSANMLCEIRSKGVLVKEIDLFKFYTK